MTWPQAYVIPRGLFYAWYVWWGALAGAALILLLRTPGQPSAALWVLIGAEIIATPGWWVRLQSPAETEHLASFSQPDEPPLPDAMHSSNDWHEQEPIPFDPPPSLRKHLDEAEARMRTGGGLPRPKRRLPE